MRVRNDIATLASLDIASLIIEFDTLKPGSPDNDERIG